MLQTQQWVTGETAAPRRKEIRRRAANRPRIDSRISGNPAANPKAVGNARAALPGPAHPRRGVPPLPGTAGDAPGSRSAPSSGRGRRAAAGPPSAGPQAFESLGVYCRLHGSESCGCVEPPDLRGREREEAAADELRNGSGGHARDPAGDGFPPRGPESGGPALAVESRFFVSTTPGTSVRLADGRFTR